MSHAPSTREHQPRTNSVYQNVNRPGKSVIVAGAVAGVVSRFCIAPLDVVKIRLQLQPRLLPSIPSHGVIGSGAPSAGALYNGIYGTMKTIIKEEGITALWKGNLPAEILYLTYGATQFYAYAQCGLATSITYPWDLLRTRFAASKARRGSGGHAYPSLAMAVRELYRNEGVRGFYRGGLAALTQIMPYMALFFGSYEGIRAALTGVIGIPPSVSAAAASGGRTGGEAAALDGWSWITQLLGLVGGADALAGVMGGVVAKTGVFPLDTIRKRLQVQGPTRGMYVHGDIPVHEGMVKCATDVVRREGWRGLYRGLTVSLVKAAPASAVTMWTYGRVIELGDWLEARGEQRL
ncbi:hypothetical protein DRE_04787 [Drechslerella stenobrocha 248]|uniref:Mitochondrial thiamine pyrophosphate carrier 1 n=1 Tax=Drechslerella stenobrocha 248 TaxID=1043628 RepID=W7HS55_9PEZI|nr:hypothetical protein DRE_04787 [Drechslerella stenobrocha 248]